MLTLGTKPSQFHQVLLPAPLNTSCHFSSTTTLIQLIWAHRIPAKQMKTNKGHIYLSLNMQIQMHPGFLCFNSPWAAAGWGRMEIITARLKLMCSPESFHLKSNSTLLFFRWKIAAKHKLIHISEAMCCDTDDWSRPLVILNRGRNLKQKIVSQGSISVLHWVIFVAVRRKLN